MFIFSDEKYIAVNHCDKSQGLISTNVFVICTCNYELIRIIFVSFYEIVRSDLVSFGMSKVPPPKPTDSELEILHVLWQHGPATVRAINDHLSQRRQAEVGYTTTLKILQLMLEKALVRRDDADRSHVYRAAVREQETQGLLLDKFVDATFGGSALKLVMQALGSRQTSADELAQIRRLLNDIEIQNSTSNSDDDDHA